MSRLYQEKDYASYKDAAGLQPRLFLEKVIKIIPSEVIAGYMFLISALPVVGSSDLREALKWIIFVLLIFVIPLYYRSLSKGLPYVKHSIVSIVAFIVWSYSISGAALTGDEYYDPIVASLSLMTFTLLSPYVPLDK
jgi:hypothetical protein